MPVSGRPPSDEWRKWYGLAVWKRRRDLQLLHEPLCRECRKRGKVTPATVADHVEPHHGDWNSFRLGKLQSLCATCHNSLKRTVELRGYDPMIGADGLPVDQRHPAYGAEHGDNCATVDHAKSDDAR
jgi:hypothetical protein